MEVIAFVSHACMNMRRCRVLSSRLDDATEHQAAAHIKVLKDKNPNYLTSQVMIEINDNDFFAT